MKEEEFQRTVIQKFDDLERRLFKDNGELSMQSRINRNTRGIKTVSKVFSVLGAFILTIVGFFINKQIKGE